MGKDLKGRELGKNISQEKSGYYMARFVDKNGRRVVKRFKKLQECRQWVADAMFTDQHSNLAMPQNLTVESWYAEWIDKKSLEIRETTIAGYKMHFRNYIKPVIGKMILKDVKPLHCQKILMNAAANNLSNNTILGIRRAMHSMFEYALDNDIIFSNPCKKSVSAKIGKEPVPRRSLTIDEQARFIERAKYSSHYNDFRFVLQTGLRVGELTGLQWSDIDLVNKRLNVRRTLSYESKLGKWYERKPKSSAGERIVPLTKEAIDILNLQKEKNSKYKIIPFEWKEQIFLDCKGEPVKDENYNKCIKRICKKCGIEKFTMHVLRHTFATRCVEAGMKPKILQRILGHSKIGMTMDLYVHAEEEEKMKEMAQIEDSLRMVQ